MDDVRQRQRMTTSDAIRNAALSGGLSGTILGGIGRALSGARNPWDIAASALLGGAGNAALTGGAVSLGSDIMGEAPYDDGSAFTKRAGLGGAVGGSLAGGGIGALAGTGALEKFFKTRLGGKLASELPIDNIIVDQAKKFMAKGVPWKRGAAIGAGLGGLLGMMQGSGEGMQVDAINNAIDEEQRKARLEEELRRQMERLGYES